MMIATASLSFIFVYSSQNDIKIPPILVVTIEMRFIQGLFILMENIKSKRDGSGVQYFV